MDEPVVQIMTAQILTDGTAVALVERVTIGGGTRVIEGEEHVHPTFSRFHVRLLSPDRMVPDQLLETESYQDAVELGLKYATKRMEHAGLVDELAASLKI